MKTIAYCNPFVPPEWLAAHGVQPSWMRVRFAEGRPFVHAGRAICPYAGVVIDEVLSELHVSATVLTTTCDQMRYATAMLESQSDVPIFLMNVPSTWQTDAVRQLYQGELERLGRFLVRLGGQTPTKEKLASMLFMYDDARSALQTARPRLSATQFAEAITEVRGSRIEKGVRTHLPNAAFPRSQSRGQVFAAHQIAGQPAGGPRRLGPPYKTERPEGCSAQMTPAPFFNPGVPLAILGGPLLEKDYAIFDLIEAAGGRLVLDATEGGERTLPARFDRGRARADPLGELTRAYFGTIPDVFRRPNDELYRWLGQELASRQVHGILLHRYVWCDIWHAELARLKEWSPVPVLEIDECDDDASLGRTAGRIEAFLEMLT